MGENFEMLKALYDFQAVYPKTISFEEGEYFILYQTSARQRNWWQVVNNKGNIGFVPSNYVVKLKVEPNFIISFLESSIESLEQNHDVEINGIMNRDELIEKLKEKKSSIEDPFKEDEYEEEPNFYSGLANQSQKKLETNKKSLSSPSVGSSIPLLIQESPSLGMINTKMNDIAQDNSITEPSSEPSETTTTPTTTSEDVVTICKDKIERNYNSVNSEDLETLKENAERNLSLKNENFEKNYSEENHQNSNSNGLRETNNYSTAINVESQDVYQVVDIIRRNTNLSFELSCEALRVVLSSLEELFPNEITSYLEAVAIHVSEKLDISTDLLGVTHDSKRLQYIFSQLAECKNDSEQRTWMLFEDQEDIIQFLEELLDILKNADETICCHEMSCDQYQSLINLVQYYQMETRWPIKMLLINVFVAACRLDHIIVDILITSVLPLELVQDFKSNFSDLEKLKEIIKLMTVIFCLGQPMPVNHQEHLGVDFINFLFEIIEGNTDHQQDILIDLVLALVLAFNLQFNESSHNIVIEAMQKLSTAKVFTEKILLYLNREDDPVKILKHSSNSFNSVVKIFIDIFSTPETANLFYTNDIKVLIDIIVRQLSDLCAGDKKRKHYLELCRRILRNTNYQEHLHRKQDLMKIFTRIFCEETECSAGDQQLVRATANEFPHIFKA